jgi:hypothetical protein
MTGAGPSATGPPSQRPYAARRWARSASGLRHWRGIKLQKWPDLVGVLWAAVQERFVDQPQQAGERSAAAPEACVRYMPGHGISTMGTET